MLKSPGSSSRVKWRVFLFYTINDEDKEFAATVQAKTRNVIRNLLLKVVLIEYLSRYRIQVTFLPLLLIKLHVILRNEVG